MKNFWKTGRQRAFDSKIDSWAVPLAFLQRAKGGLTISPPRNLVSNQGIDANATHTKDSTWYSNFEAEDYATNFELEVVNRITNANKNNILLERCLYQITKRNILSYLAMKLFDFLRFQTNYPIISLEERIKNTLLDDEEFEGIN